MGSNWENPIQFCSKKANDQEVAMGESFKPTLSYLIKDAYRINDWQVNFVVLLNDTHGIIDAHDIS